MNTEHWLDILETETFPTVYCEFKLEEAEIFMDIYKRYAWLSKPSLHAMFSTHGQIQKVLSEVVQL